MVFVLALVYFVKENVEHLWNQDKEAQLNENNKEEDKNEASFEAFRKLKVSSHSFILSGYLH